jgi:Na+/H+ antiporter NhaD/arsenite permease-like protein
VTTLAVGIFAATYVLIAARKLRWLPIGRPAGALVGAVAMVAFGVLTPAESYAAVDHATIVLLFGMMMLAAYLDAAGFFHRMSAGLVAACRTPSGLLTAVALVPGILSAFLVNDAVCVFLTPVVVDLCRRHRLPFPPFLLALATSANIGSAATLVGNPQNMIIGSMSGYGFASFLARSAPAAAAGLLVNLGLLHAYFGRRLPARFGGDPPPPPPPVDLRFVRVALVAAGIVLGFFLGGDLGYVTLAGVTVLVLVEHREPRAALGRVDWSLLVFFCALFVVVAGLASTGLVARAWGASAPFLRFDDAGGLASFTGLMTAGSNLVSNVPMVLLTGPHLAELGDPALGWVLLAFVTTVAGNLTLIGSVANIIVAEGAREHHALGFWEYLRFGAVSTVLVLAVGVPILVWTSG